jgi:transcriptional regulator with XRE-family HTH domain
VSPNRPTAASSHAHDRWSFLGGLLVKAREDAHLTQRGLAKKLHRPQSFVAKYERVGRRLCVQEFMEVCAAIGCDAPAMLRALCKGVPATGRGGCG